MSLGVLGLAYLLPALSRILSWIMCFCLVLYIASFVASFGRRSSPRIRGSAMSVCSILHCSANLLVSLTFFPLIAAIGETATFWIYGLIAIGTFVFVYLLMPETRGRSLERIEVNLSEKAAVT